MHFGNYVEAGGIVSLTSVASPGVRFKGGEMRASETTFVGMVQGQKQFQIPLYQRTYSWTEAELERLWEDVLDQADLLARRTDGASHFLGPVVLAPSPITEASFERWLVVDGQQRLTTLSLALAAVRDHSATEDPRTRERIDEQFLVNKWQNGDERFRLLPTQADRASYAHCLTHGDAPGGDLLAMAYRYFRRALVAADDPADPHDIERIEQVLATRMSLVLVTVDKEDNVHRIFESLNNTGRRLSQADLMRNYLFMRLPTRAQRVYESYWLPLQSRLKNDELEELMWLLLVLSGDDRAGRRDMYAAQRDELEKLADEAAIEAYIKELYRRSLHYERLIHPSIEDDLEIRQYLARLNQWKGSAAYPAIMVLYDQAEKGTLTTSDFVRALSYIESFLVRRMICQVPANSLARIFQSLPVQLPAGQPVADGLRWVLSGERRFWPSDEELRDAVRGKPFYWQGRSEQRRLVLQRLEESHEHPEPVDFVKSGLTVEHVMPQTPGPEWLEGLADDPTINEPPAQVHERLVHTLGNLTLTAVNSKLSNHPFQRKQDLLVASHLEMNRQIAATARWGAAEILARADELTGRAIVLWPAPIQGGHRVERGRDWALLDQALAAMPGGTWTSYGDLAALIGSHSVPVGQHLANTTGLLNAYRVLTAEGRVSDSFRWGSGEDRGDVRDVLRSDGVDLDSNGVANQAQRLSSRDLADLVGLTNPDEFDQQLTANANGLGEQRFLAQLKESNSPEVVVAVDDLLQTWVSLEGVLGYGRDAATTSCSLLLSRTPSPTLCPLVLHPTEGVEGSAEVAFGHLARCEPFDDVSRRDELRLRLNQIPSVDIPPNKLTLRASFPLSIIGVPANLARLQEILAWVCRPF